MPVIRRGGSSSSLSGSGASTRLAYWSGANALTSKAGLEWDDGLSRLSAPGDIFAVGGQFNGASLSVSGNIGGGTIQGTTVQAGTAMKALSIPFTFDTPPCVASVLGHVGMDSVGYATNFARGRQQKMPSWDIVQEGVVQTSDAVSTTCDTITPVNGGGGYVEAFIMGRTTVANTAIAYHVRGAFTKSGGTVTLSTLSPVAMDSMNATADGTLVASGGDILVRVQGIAATVFHWRSRVHLMYVNPSGANTLPAL